MSPEETDQVEDVLKTKVESLFNLLINGNTMYQAIVNSDNPLPIIRKDMLETKFGADEDGFSYETLVVDVVDALVGYEQGEDVLSEIIDSVDDIRVEMGERAETRTDLIEQSYRSAEEYRGIDELECLVAFDVAAMKFVGSEDIDLTQYKAKLARMVCMDATNELKENGGYNDSVAAKIRHFRDVSTRIHLSDELRKLIEVEVILPAAYGAVVTSINSNNGFNPDTEGILEDARIAAMECGADAIVNEGRVRVVISKRAKELIEKDGDLEGALSQFEYVTRLNIGTETEIRKSAEGVVASAYHKLLSMLNHIHDFTSDHEHYRSKVVEFAQTQGIDTAKLDAKLVGRARARAIAYVRESIQEGAKRQHAYQAQLNVTAGTDATRFNNTYTQEAYRNVEQAVRETLSASDYKRGECWAEAESWLQFARESITDVAFAGNCEDRIFSMLAREIKGASKKRSRDVKRAKLGLTYIKELADDSSRYTARNYSAQIVSLEAGFEGRAGVLTQPGRTGWLKGVLHR